MKECYLYKSFKNGKVQCLNCAHKCLIGPGKRGICGVKENINGKLYALNYGKCVALNIDPIEKKPFFHFLPGSSSLSIATVGCNFRCLNCQNYDISQEFKNAKEIPGKNILPEKIVEIAVKNRLPSISYTYTEPAIFMEYALKIMKLAKRAGLKNNWVSNGFWSKELFGVVAKYIDAANIDLKSFDDKFYIKYCGGRLIPVLDTLIKIKKQGIWLEITTLIIPGLNDSKTNFQKIAKFIKENLGSETPWHLTQFCGAISWKLKNLKDTPIKTLKKAVEIGKKTGLKYVYAGNISNTPLDDTFCPQCNTLCVDRNNYLIRRYDKNGKCPECSFKLNIID